MLKSNLFLILSIICIRNDSIRLQRYVSLHNLTLIKATPIDSKQREFVENAMFARYSLNISTFLR